jgi:photosystem II stability/assembly factor-like uncharacterized protein
MGAVPQVTAGRESQRRALRRRLWRLVSVLVVTVLGAAPTALAVPGGPVPENEVDPGAWLQGLQGGPIPHPSNGNYGVLNTSAVNAANANQVNDPSLDRAQSFPGAPPFVTATESETSVAVAGKNVVVGYNSSAGTTFTDAAGDVSQLLLDGYSVSHDGGQTWRSGFIPAEPGAPPNDYGDPSVVSDRAGNFYYASLSWFGLQVAKSSDGGNTWTTSNVAPTYISPSNQPDKEWLAVGPDPRIPARDDLYVTWTQYVNNSSRLMMVRSTDGGTTWSSPQILYKPKATSLMSSYIQFSNPVVDASTGRLYIPFLHFSNTDADDVQVLVSDDGGQTFQFLKFNVPGAPDPTMFPNVTPGSLTDCGIYGGNQLTIHQGSATTSASGLPRWAQATRMTAQPAAAAAGGRLLISLNSSTSPTYGAGTGSEIRLLYSPDGGKTWAPPASVASSTSSDPQHFLPAITIDPSGSHVQVVYYDQNAAGKVSVDSQSGTVSGGGVSFAASRQLASPFDLPPTNITISPTVTASYDAVTVPCYAVGEYLSVTQTGAAPVAAWGGDRQLWKEPPGALIGGVHAQPDVFFGSLG